MGGVLQRASRVFHGEGWQSGRNHVAEIRALKHVVRESISPLEYLENLLHPWVGFAIMPLFALANAGVPLTLAGFGEPVAISVAAGLVVGKPLGIVAVSWLAVRLGLARLPDGITWPVILAGGLLAGIGFTMSLFISGLALDGEVLDAAKIGVLGGSALAGVLGMGLLLWFLPSGSRD